MMDEKTCELNGAHDKIYCECAYDEIEEEYLKSVAQIETLTRRVLELEEKLGIARKGLEFYADKTNWAFTPGKPWEVFFVPDDFPLTTPELIAEQALDTLDEK